MTPSFNIQTFKDWRYLADYPVDAADEPTYQLLDNLLMQSVKFGQFFWALPPDDQEQIMASIRESLLESQSPHQPLQESPSAAFPLATDAQESAAPMQATEAFDQ